MKAFALTLGPALSSTIPAGFGVFKRIWIALQVAAERRDLRRLDARALGDMGISHDAAAREASRPIWDLPANR